MAVAVVVEGKVAGGENPGQKIERVGLPCFFGGGSYRCCWWW